MIGGLRRRAQVQVSTVTQNDLNEPVDTWSNLQANGVDLPRLPCDVVKMTAKEQERANQTKAIETVMISTRYLRSTPLDSTMRMILNNKTYNFISVENVGMNNHELRIMAGVFL